MPGNSFGTLFKLSSYGESHGPQLGGMVEGCPAGITLDMDSIQEALDRRKPGQSSLVSPRKENDTVHIVSGVFEGKTTGAPIGFYIANQNTRSDDYDHLRDHYRPGHADWTYTQKYGLRDHRGGGRSSARETAIRVVGGAIARQCIPFVQLTTYVSQIGSIGMEAPYIETTTNAIEASAVRCPDPQCCQAMTDELLAIQQKGDTVGGVISCVAHGVPAGWGEPIFDKLPALMAKAMMSINAAKGFEMGSGFAAASMLGSAHNDLYRPDGSTQTNHAGGTQGGISNGMPLCFRVAFKPISTLMQGQPHLSHQGEVRHLPGKGRHDACVVPRAVPIVEAMAYMVLADLFLQHRAYAPFNTV